MTSLIASLVFAAVIPSDFVDSVGSAAYWYKKDSRGRGDSISEEAKPKRFPAFALAKDTFVLADPAVRTQHLDKVEFWFNGERFPAKEIARGENPDTVTIRTEKPVDGVKPLEFAGGNPVEQLTWGWEGDYLNVESSRIGTNDDVKVNFETHRPFHQGKGNSLLLDAKRRPVGIDFGELSFVAGDRWTGTGTKAGGALPPDSLDKAAGSVERLCESASLPIVIHLEQQDKDSRSRSRWNYSDEGSANSETDTMGLVIDGKVFARCLMGGEDIARFKSAEATFADGTKTNLVFLGALTEWKAVVFGIPEGFADKVSSLKVCTEDPHKMLGSRSWAVTVENEAGHPLAEAVRGRFIGVEFLRGAKFAAVGASLRGYDSYSDRNSGNICMTVTPDGAIANMTLKRRYGSEYSTEKICPADLADAIAGKAFNPEFRPRTEEDRNRIVWLGIESVELTDALAREKKVQSFTSRYSRPPLVTEVYPDSPCAKAGIKVGDIVLAYRRGSDEEHRIHCYGDYSGRDWSEYFGMDEYYSSWGISATPWTDVENDTNRELSKFGVGAKVTIAYVRDGKRQETELTLEPAPPHYKNATKSRNRALGTLVKDMTFEVRRFFKFDAKEPGVVIAKIKPGSPAAVAGLKVYELITEVNGEKVTGAKDFAAKIKDKKDLVFAVRRLSQTRMVKIHVQ